MIGSKASVRLAFCLLLYFTLYEWVERINESQLPTTFFFLIFNFLIEVPLLYHLHGIRDARMTVNLASSVLLDLLV